MAAILFKGIAARSLTTRLTSSCYYGMKYSTKVSNDPDTHDDFKPANKLDSSGASLSNIIEQDVKDNPVMLYMKGVPDFPQCGFSSLAVKVLKQYNVPLSAVMADLFRRKKKDVIQERDESRFVEERRGGPDL